MRFIPAFVLGSLVSLGSCSHAPPQMVQVFDQVNHVYDPAAGTWSDRLSVYLQGASSDGTKVFDRFHLILDDQQIYFSVSRSQWASVDKPGEFWVGASDLSLPDGKVPVGSWRAVLVTRAGQKVETPFVVTAVAPDAPPAQTGPVTVKQDPKDLLRFEVTGWVEDYLVWARDAQGTVISRNKTVGSSFQVPGGASTVVLYSYDKARGTGIEAGPFPVQSLH